MNDIMLMNALKINFLNLFDIIYMIETNDNIKKILVIGILTIIFIGLTYSFLQNKEQLFIDNVK